MDKQTIKEVSNILNKVVKLKEETDKVIREHDEWEAHRNEREQIRLDLVERYKKLWKDNYRKLLNAEVDLDYLFDLEEELRKWMHDLHTFTMKFSDDKLIFNLHWNEIRTATLRNLNRNLSVVIFIFLLSIGISGHISQHQSLQVTETHIQSSIGSYISGR